MRAHAQLITPPVILTFNVTVDLYVYCLTKSDCFHRCFFVITIEKLNNSLAQNTSETINAYFRHDDHHQLSTLLWLHKIYVHKLGMENASPSNTQTPILYLPENRVI